MPVLGVCGGYQLLAKYYGPAEGPELEGIGIFDAWTIHKGKEVARCIGNVALEWGESTLVGFENHGGRTYLGSGAQPLGRVLAGHGNNSEDGREGCVYRNTFGTYLHGSLLPKIRISPTIYCGWRWIAAMGREAAHACCRSCPTPRSGSRMRPCCAA